MTTSNPRGYATHRNHFDSRSRISTFALWLGMVLLSGMLSAGGSAHEDSTEEELDSALIGEWEIVEMIYKGRLQDFGGGTGGRIKFENGKMSIASRDGEYGPNYDCTAAAREIDVRINDLICKGLYEIKDEKVRIIWRFGDRPASFDAVADPRLTLYVLRRIPK